MGDKSPKSMRRDRKQKDAAKNVAKKKKEARQQAHSQVPSRDKR